MRPPSHVVPPAASRRPGALTSAERAAWELATPFVEVDAGGTVERCSALGAALEVAVRAGVVRHVVSTAGDDAALRLLAARGTDFEVATPREARAALAAGATPDDLTYCGSVAHHARVADAAALGVRMFVVRTIAEVDDIVAAAPGTAVLCRLAGPALRAGQPRRRALRPEPLVGQAVEVLRHAAGCGLDPAGVAVDLDWSGSGKHGAATLVHAAARVFQTMRRHDARPWLLSLTADPGGMSGHADEASVAVHALADLLDRAFGAAVPRVSLATGPWLVDTTATLVASVVSVTWQGSVRRVVLDATPYPSQPDGAARREELHVETSADDLGASGPCVLTAVGADGDGSGAMLVRLPLALSAGDVVRVAGVPGAPAWRGVPVVTA